MARTHQEHPEVDNYKLVREMDEFATAYVEAALWASSMDEGGTSFQDADYGLNNIDPSTLKKMIADCRKFETENLSSIMGGYIGRSRSDDSSMAGHDFWMTGNSHGVGFWEDDDWEEKAGAELDKAAKKFGEYDLYLGDDGLIYGSRG